MTKIKKIAMLTVAVATLGGAVVVAHADNPHPWLIDQWDHSSTSGSTNAYSNYSVFLRNFFFQYFRLSIC